jgi:outer membrane protein assembly factor BamC
MKLRNIVFGLMVASMFAGCSIFDHKPVDYKAAADVTPSLEVPPDLTVPETEQRYLIPGADGQKAASYSEYAKKTEQPCVSAASAPAASVPAPVDAPAQQPIPSAKLQDNKGIKSILLGEPFDRSWRRVGLALDHARINVTDKDRSKGIYFVAPLPDKDSKDNKQKQSDYQVNVHENANGTEVTVVDQNGKNDAAATKLVEAIYQNLDKSDRGTGGRHPRGDAVRPSR